MILRGLDNVIKAFLDRAPTHFIILPGLDNAISIKKEQPGEKYFKVMPKINISDSNEWYFAVSDKWYCCVSLLFSRGA